MTEPELPSSVLVIDDDPQVLAYATDVLVAAGYPVQCAASHAEASALLKSERYAVVLADMVLPESNGLDILAEVRKVSPLTVGILMTGYASTESAVEALRQGAYDYLLKPCEPDILVAAVRRASEHYRLNVSLMAKTAQLEKVQTQLSDKSRMMQNISHELKNPLSVVYGYAAFLLKEEAAPEDLKRSLTSIYNNAERLGHLLEELQESTRLANHKIELAREAVPASQLCSDTADNFNPEAAKRGVTLAVECRCPGALVLVDSKRVHQVLSNLMANALKFTKTGGKITISADADEGFVRFGVKDTGCGIPAAELPHLFERFYQSEETRHQHSGLGLGLEIARGLVELHGGRIWAKSKPGEGAAFYFTLPLAIDAAAALKPQARVA